MKNKLFSSILVFLCCNFSLQAQHLEKLWESDTTFKVPESVIYYKQAKTFFVSNINGGSNEKDGNGFISRIRPDGKILKSKWGTGLNAPKGMAIYQNELFVADVDAIIAFDLRSGNKTRGIKITGAKFLNDLTVDEKGNLYVSDSETGIIHVISDGKPQSLITKRKRPNGVLWNRDKLFFLDAGSLFAWRTDSTIVEIAKGMETSTDGIEMVDDTHMLVSSWIGAIYLVDSKGTVKELINTKAEKINSADICYVPETQTLYVPTFSSNKIVAYKLVMK